MSNIDGENVERESTSGMNIVVQGSLDASDSGINQVLADFTKDELVVSQTADACSGEGRTVEIRAGEGETLLQFHDACVKHDILFSIEHLSRQ